MHVDALPSRLKPVALRNTPFTVTTPPEESLTGVTFTHSQSPMFFHHILLLLATSSIFAPLAFASKLAHADAPFQRVSLLAMSEMVAD
jgi:hypothetical protein